MERADDLATVVSAVGEVCQSNRKVARRSGKNELFEHRPAALKGWPRARVRKAIEAAIDAGQLIVDGHYVLVP